MKQNMTSNLIKSYVLISKNSTIYAPFRDISAEIIGESNWGIRVNCT